MGNVIGGVLGVVLFLSLGMLLAGGTYALIKQQDQITALESQFEMIRNNANQPPSVIQLNSPSPVVDLSEINGKLDDLEMVLHQKTSRQQLEVSTLLRKEKSMREHMDTAMEQSRDFSSTIGQSMDAVIAIGVVSTLDNGEEHFDLVGSGVLVTIQGDAITNIHVMEAVKSSIENQEEYCQDLYYYDLNCAEEPQLRAEARAMNGKSSLIFTEKRSETYDLALIGTSLGNKMLQLGNSDEAYVGEEVAALGHPDGLEFTATQGIVSAINRNLDDIGEGGPWIQTDTPINGGNSGGPLINKEGEIIGINTLGFGLGENGLNFAIPSNIVKDEFGLG